MKGGGKGGRERGREGGREGGDGETLIYRLEIR
jgi:hypothetical protein